MDIEVTQQKLAKALSATSRVASSRSDLAILKNVLLRSIGKQLQVTATNLEIASVQQIGSKITEPGSITVPARLITDLVGNLTKQTLRLTTSGNVLTISSSTTTTKINGVSDDEFPEIPVIDSHSTKFSLDAAVLKDAIQKTTIAASTDSTRPILTGVYWHADGSELALAATDGYRLSEYTIQHTAVAELDAIVPLSTMQELARQIDSEDEVEIEFTDTQVQFNIDGNILLSRLIDGKFPDYKKLIPTKFDNSALLPLDELKRTVKLSSLFGRDNTGVLTLSFDKENQALHVKSITAETGDTTSAITATITGDDLSTNLNSRYLTDCLSVIASHEVTIETSDKLTPCIIRDTKDSAYLHLIMPIKS